MDNKSEVFPRMGLRVLLVETDDSTRLLIAALLRKCSYKVVAVSDGLKAWETLKARPHNIDLILTEVDLPSISGYALLTLIMEHDICKRIPVIMTSSQDSISLVLRCTLRGAADFLVKPIRRNELRNLWHHVWRRQTKTEVPAVQNTMGAQHKHKIDASCDKKAGNDLSSSNMNGRDRRREESPQLIRKSVLPTTEIGSKPSGSEVISREETNKSTVSSLGENLTSARSSDANEFTPSDLEHVNISGDTYHCTNELVEQSAAIDYISKFENYSGNIKGCSSAECGVEKLSFTPYLELSLRRPCLNGREDEGTVEQPRLNHSDVSAFSLYDNGKTLQSLSQAMGSNCGNGTVLTGSREDPMTRDGKIAVFSLDTIWDNYIPPKLHTGSGLKTNSMQNVEDNDSIGTSTNGVRDASPVLEPSSTSSSCSGAGSKLKSSTCFSLCSTVDNSNSGPSVAVTKSSVSKGLNNSFTLVQEGMADMDSHSPSQREAALQKFRLKRKDRCFDKKVRYQSRKRLAEQRPRVKGQFVRQVKAESSLPDGCEYPSRLTNFDLKKIA